MVRILFVEVAYVVGEDVEIAKVFPIERKEKMLSVALPARDS